MRKLFWRLMMIRSSTNNKLLKKICSFLTVPILSFNGSYIGSGARFGSVPVLPHGVKGIFISSGAVIGKNTVIFHQVTIGSNTLADSKGNGAPVVGDDCFIGAGAKIIGDVHIGNNCRIGANCVVVKDVADNSTVVCQPARVIIKENPQNNKHESFKKT